jgi:hypothetical protein
MTETTARVRIDIVETGYRVIDSLNEAPHYAEVQGRDGLPCRVWINPSRREFATAIRRSSDGSTAGLRGLVTATDLYTWQSLNLLHMDFEREIGVLGVRVGLRAGVIQVNDETVAQPEHFPWIFPDTTKADEIDIENRRSIVEQWLAANKRLAHIYPQKFTVSWYA